jgi:integrase/recombinase XerD
VAPPPAVLAQTPAERLLEDYQRFLVGERGLNGGTARGYALVVGPLLVGRERAGGLDLQRVGARDVTAFLVARRETVRGREVVTALRSLLGFLALEGLVEGDLAAAVPSVASWRLAGIPPTLAPGQAQLLLSSCDRSSVLGRRDFAILTILARLGLRRGELAALSLDDIRWRAGEIVLSNRKRARRETLPLPIDVGEAISEYLRGGRPAGALTRCVFVRGHAPLGGLSGAGVGSVVAAACDRAGIDRVGAHRLRHSVASDILRAGAGLEEVGQVLGHRLPRTTAIYAKVDLRALRLIARPWPGGVA